MSKTIQLKFDDKQEHQLLAVESTVRLFDELSRQDESFQLGDEIVPNMPPATVLEENWLLANLSSVRTLNGLQDPLLSLDVDDGFELDGISNNSWRYPNFTLEMETGTGKTYVYLRTILELKKHYGFRKFVVVVPSIAIYEGVIKNFAITRTHFRTLYGNEPIHLTQYDGQQLSKLRNFASSSFLEVLAITLDSFNKNSNVIFKASEKLPGERKPYQYIQETRPILILDEPQNMESEKARSALRTLHPLFAIRYSATHRTNPNLLYRLSPVDALKHNLVKRIQVYGVKEEENYNQMLFSFESFVPYGLAVRVRTLINTHGVTTEGIVELKKGDDVFSKTKHEAYRGLIVEDIDKNAGVVVFTNGYKLAVKEATPSKPEVFRAQIEETVERHMQAQMLLKDRNIKVLSLFFIDRVANYTDNKGLIKTLFDEAFERLKKKYDFFNKFSSEEVRSAYFAKKKQKDGAEVEIDTEGKNEDERKAEKEAFRLIMRDKERLLSFDEKVAFIFAHSALKEGWDNPNVFQICTLNETRSEMKKRQEIGRGLRLCVDQTGERVMEEGVNVLTVVANDSYESYVRSLQMEYQDDGEAAPAPPTNARRDFSKRNDKIFRSKDFKEFWEKLNRKTSYRINVDTENLIGECVSHLKATQFPEPRVVVTKGKFVITSFQIELISVTGYAAKLKVTISDSSGDSNTVTKSFEQGKDLSRELKDVRLKGYKLVVVRQRGDDSEVIFGNDNILTKYHPITFDTEEGQKIDSRSVVEPSATYPVFNFIDRAARETGLTRPTLNRIFRSLPGSKKELIFKNPQGFCSKFIDVVKNVLADHVALRIEYIVDGDPFIHDVEQLFPKNMRYAQKEVIPGDENSLYDQVQCDSDVEMRFVQYRLQKEDEMVLYFKFPSSFRINIPKVIGNYNPDWGIIRWTSEEPKMKLQLVRETKGTMDRNLLQYPHEKRKLDCAEKHFEALGVDYRQIDDKILYWWKNEKRK